MGYAYADTVDEHRTGERMIGRMGGGPLGRGGIFWIRVVVVLIRSWMLVRAELVWEGVYDVALRFVIQSFRRLRMGRWSSGQ